jgi:hypothetical protein
VELIIIWLLKKILVQTLGPEDCYSGRWLYLKIGLNAGGYCKLLDSLKMKAELQK